ncbi:MAG TPA: isochorismatase family cysteine hydrolase [Candidatus Dormibacteraeota bacterium]|nr:isochorismatase family cysteine hydrolase [Candidatus Dormibacteraeota bacterium]
MPQRKIVFWSVDIQADFMLPSGKLYVPGAEKLIPNIHRLVSAALASGTLIVSSADAHTPNDTEFANFPPHCVAGTPGARILPEALGNRVCTVANDASQKLPADILSCPQILFEKQTLDVFDNPRAGELMDRLGPDEEYVIFGVVTELCVRCAAKGLLERRRKVSIVIDAIETLQPENGRRTLQELQSLGARLITTQAALAMIGSPPAKPAASSAEHSAR